jgi:hypothetical protein
MSSSGRSDSSWLRRSNSSSSSGESTPSYWERSSASQYAGNAAYDAVIEIATDGLGKDPHGYRAEFLELVRQAKQWAKSGQLTLGTLSASFRFQALAGRKFEAGRFLNDHERDDHKRAGDPSKRYSCIVF